MCDITCTKALSRKWRMRCHPTVPFHSQLQLPPPNSPLPTYQECNTHRDQQAQFVTEVSHQQLALRKGATWEHMRSMDSHLIRKFPMQNICQPSYIGKGSQLGERLFPEVKLFWALHKADTMFASNIVFWYHYHQCSETFRIPTVSHKMASDERHKVCKIVRKWSTSLFMHKVYSLHASVVLAYTFDHIENLASPLLQFNTQPVWRL